MHNLGRLLARIETMSMRGRERRWALMPAGVARLLRPRVLHVGDGLALIAGGSDSLQLNRVIALGHRGRARESMLGELATAYAGAGVRRFAVELGPGPQAGDIARWLTKRGFVRRGGYSVLLRDLHEPIVPATARIRVARVRRAGLGVFVDIMNESFRSPASQRPWSLAAAKASGIERLLALVGRSPAGAASMVVDRDVAWFSGGATRARWRRHGAHAALIAARLRLAARRGCRWAWSETLAPVRGRPQGSRRNLMRQGFAEVCRKTTFVSRRG